MKTMSITTKNTSNAAGLSQVIAKGGGKQRTVPVDRSKGYAWNHGNAAGELALVHGLKWSDSITHDMSADGTSHIFTWA